MFLHQSSFNASVHEQESIQKLGKEREREKRKRFKIKSTYNFLSESKSCWASSETLTPLESISLRLSATFFCILCLTFATLMFGRAEGSVVIPFCCGWGVMLRSEMWRRLMMCTSPEEREGAVDWGVVLEGLMLSIKRQLCQGKYYRYVLQIWHGITDSLSVHIVVSQALAA